MTQDQQLTKQLVPLIIFIVVIILVTLIIRGSRSFPSADNPLIAESDLEMRLSPFSYSKPAGNFDEKKFHLYIPDVENTLSSAARECSGGNYAVAEDMLRTALVFHPDNRALLSLLGNVLYMQRKYPAAEGIFRHLTVLNPEDTAAYSNLGAALAGQKRFTEAIVNAKKVFRKTPGSATAALNLSGMYSMAGNTAEALEYFRKAYEKLGENILPLSFNPNFDNIRKEKLFKKIVRDAKEKRKKTAENTIEKNQQENVNP